MIAQGHGVRTGRRPREVAGISERDRHGRSAARGPGHGEDRVVRAEGRDDRTGHVDREIPGGRTLAREPGDALLHEVELEHVAPAGRRRGHGRVDRHALTAEDVAAERRARSVPDDVRTARARPVVREVDRERARCREDPVADVANGHWHGRRLARRETRSGVEGVRGFEVDAHAGARVVVGDALVIEREFVLLVEVDRHRVVGRIRRRGHRDLHRDGLTRLHVARQRDSVRSRERVAGRVAHPLVAELHGTRARRVPHATAVVREGDADHPRLPRGPADRNVVTDPVDAPVRPAEILLADGRAVHRVPPGAGGLQIPTHDVVADRWDRERHVHAGDRPRHDVGGDRRGAALRHHGVRPLQDFVGDARPRRDVLLAAVRDGDADGQVRARVSGFRKRGLEPGHLVVPVDDRGLSHLSDRRELRVKRVAGAGGLPAVLALDVVAVAVPLDVRRIRRDVHPRPVAGLLLVDERIGAVRLHAELRELHRDDVRD